MQSNEIVQARLVADFLTVARLHFGLPSAAPSNIRVPAPFGRLRPMLRSLLVIGSLGTLLMQPTFAIDTLRPITERDTQKNSNKGETTSLTSPVFTTLAEKSSQN